MMNQTDAILLGVRMRPFWALLLGLVASTVPAKTVKADKGVAFRPNIVWIMAEDIGCDLASWGTPGVDTPFLDGLADEGLLLERLYCTSPICSPNRSAMMTGMYQTTIGAHHHRSHRGDGYALPEPVRPLTHLLREAGYFCSVGNGYGGKTDLNFRAKPAGHGDAPLFNGKDWSERQPDQPFFAQITLNVTHRGKWWDKTRTESPDPVSPEEVSLPPYLPDHPEIRKDWALYLDQIEKADRQIGQILKRLEDEGIADRTLVVFIGDNGRCVFRGKGFLYEDGIRVPGIIRWPGRLHPGQRSDELVSVIDLTAQVLAAAGIAVPPWMQGRAFLEDDIEARAYCFAARDRWDEVYDKSRAVVGPRFKYIRNDMPEVPIFTYQRYLENVRPIRPVLWELHQTGKMSPQQAQFMAAHKPREELYDLEADPWEMNNLAVNTEYDGHLRRLRSALNRWEEETGDLGRNAEAPSAVGQALLKRIRSRPDRIRESGTQ